MKKLKVLLLTLALVSLLVAPGLVKAETLMMATTTSTDNTGLLDELAPMFQKDTGIELKWTAVVMYNDFVIIGPDSDPAGIKGLPVVQAMKAVADAKAAFVSRGDNSGTNKKEISLWKVAGMAVPDKAEWYIQTGQGMIKSITVAEERDAYIMTDRGTYIKYSANKNGSPELKVLVEGDKSLFNQYSVLAV
ncbi:substrate-binding domain-containing protein, partial [Aduncisulcus paluster]